MLQTLAIAFLIGWYFPVMAPVIGAVVTVFCAVQLFAVLYAIYRPAY